MNDYLESSDLKRKKVALVTGASGGIGGAMARKLASRGFVVALHYHSNWNAVHEVMEDIKANDGNASAFQADVRNINEIEELFNNVTKSLGGIDVFINNVGIPAKGMKIEETEEDTFDRIFTVNTKAALFALKYASKHVGDDGRIINISSSTTYFPTENLGIYTASKAAMKTFTEVLCKRSRIQRYHGKTLYLLGQQFLECLVGHLTN